MNCLHLKMLIDQQTLIKNEISDACILVQEKYVSKEKRL